MIARTRIVLPLVAALAVATATWPGSGSARAQSESATTESQARAVPPGPLEVEAIETVRGPVFSAWSTPEPLWALNTAASELPTGVSRDGLCLYLSRVDSVTGEDLYVAHRPAVGSGWSIPFRLPDTVNTNANERAAWVSPDGTSLYFASDRAAGVGGFDLYVSRRPAGGDDGDWQPPVNLSSVNSLGFDAGSMFFVDEFGATRLYFGCDPELGGIRNLADIYESVLGPAGFEPPSLVAGLNSPWDDRQPYARRDGLEIYFSSNRTGFMRNVFRSVRSSACEPWSPPVAAFDRGAVGLHLMTTISSPVLSWDGTTLYVGISTGDATSYDVYVAHRRRMLGAFEP